MTCHKANLRSQQCRNIIPYFTDIYFGEEHIWYISGNKAQNYAVFCHHFIILNFAVFLLITPELSEVKNSASPFHSFQINSDSSFPILKNIARNIIQNLKIRQEGRWNIPLMLYRGESHQVLGRSMIFVHFTVYD